MGDERVAWPPKRSETEQRRMRARLLYDLEMEYRKVGWGDPAYVYDEENGLFRFRDGRFAFSREHADWELLSKRGRLRGYEQRVVDGVAAGEHRVEVDDFDFGYGQFADGVKVASFADGRIGYREWARRNGRLGDIHTIEVRYDHDVDELMS